MAEEFAFDLVFALPDGERDAFALSDAVYEAGFKDALVGTGSAGFLAVSLTVEGDDAETVIKNAARDMIAVLPAGTSLHEVREVSGQS